VYARVFASGVGVGDECAHWCLCVELQSFFFCVIATSRLAGAANDKHTNTQREMASSPKGQKQHVCVYMCMYM
jgi:hypothetical protein